MNKNAVIVWWIEAGSGELRSEMMEPYHLRRGVTYEDEVLTKYAVDPVEMVTIPMSSAGDDWAKAELARLREKSQAIMSERKKVDGD